ncbi:secretion protein HlyD family protein [Allomuricauda ruestringensis DSM 13258]|uniref:Secretion protein HlyD family protein n=1 Tax=Allomuricauda ruestringensis (strain DSM 13258 / CIP 107369 / LMG 19739 / B1) TaxID=886377 RepID=G2PKR0_ALLRU|nr:secretion protein HlyD family protein [Allomuricauda ruestringensis DSM 13258]
MQIFPKEIIENTVQAYIPKNGVKSKAIYSLLLFFILSIICALPFIKVKVYTNAQGLVKPSKERIAITSLNSGKVLFSGIESNKYVDKGDVLLILENNVLNEQIALTKYDTKRLSEQIRDLQYLLSQKRIQSDSMLSAKYQKEYFQFLEISFEHRTRIKKLKVDYERNHKLLTRGVIAKAEFENIKLEYDLALNAYSQFKKQQFNTWESSLTALKNELEITQNKSSQYLESKKEHVVTAPVSGSLVNPMGIEKGSIITSGSILTEISPDTKLLAECYVSPLDIGLIDKSKSVNFQIDAFNYNQWGLATGKILEISEDIELINEQPIFKMRCQINEEFLELKNGAKGTIKKGMTFNARFELTERTLYQLLYDKVDDWMNPTNQNSQITSIE